MRRAVAVLVAFFLAVPLAGVHGGTGLEQFEKELIGLAEKLAPSVVRVHATGPDGFGGTKELTVSGVVLDGRATIATLGTVLSGVTRVEIQPARGGRRPARVLGVDERFNVGILQADPEGLSPVVPAPEGSVRVGAFAIAVGNPFGLTNTVGLGIVSGLGREVQGQAVIDGRRTSVMYYDLIQTTAPVNPGDSGGLLADSRGRMIGMISSTFARAPSVQRIRMMIRDFARRVDLDQVQMFLDALQLNEEQKAVVKLLMGRLKEYQKRLRESGDEGPAVYDGLPRGATTASLGAHGINFALPLNQVRYAARMIRAHGRVVRLGVRLGVPDAAVYSQAGLRPGQGLHIQELVPESPASRAGLKVHDLIVSLGGHPLGHPRDVRRALVASPVTGPIPVVFYRAGKRRETTVRFD